jgi:alkanesulfonate monooxygenase SsuD/methylene tetrahydromethanopterin reductase-like flavin-dependent oxidoreductase (luciferase family)
MTRTKNRVRFGVNVGSRSFAESLEICLAAERHGFDVVAFSDRPPDPSPEAWTAITAVGAQTSKIIVTHSSLNVPFRSPALLAKMAATLDAVLGPGRVELTMGAGAQQQHFESYGVPFGDAAWTFAGLRDAVHIMRGMWANESFTYEGKVHSVTDAHVGIHPADGRIPIAIAAIGPQMMRFTGRNADGWMKNHGWPESLDQLQGLVQMLEQGAEEVGRDPLLIRRMLNGGAALGNKAVERAQSAGTRGPSYLAGPHVYGSADQVLETIETYRDAGIDDFRFRFPEPLMLEQIQMFGEEILSKVK